MVTAPVVRAALKELYVLKSIVKDIVYYVDIDLLLFIACSLKPLICLIKKLEGSENYHLENY